MNFKDLSDRVKFLLQNPPNKKSETGDLMNGGIWGGNTPTKQWFDLYSENPRLSVVHKIAEDNGATEYSISAKTNRSEYYVRNHPLEQEIRKHSVPQFFALWTAYRLMKGVVYIAFDMTEGYPTNFKIFTTIHLSKGAMGDASYSFKYGNETLTYPASQVIIDTDLDLSQPYFNGKGKAEAIKDEIETDEFVQKYIKYFYINSARPDIFITAEAGEEMSETDVNRLESSWNQKFQGVTNAHRPVFLNWAAKVTSVPTSHKDMELLDTRRFYRDTTIQHFGVPPEIMGIIENSNRATVIAAEHIYAKQVRMPILKGIELIINTKLITLYQDKTEMEFEFEDIIPDDIELTQKIVDSGIKERTLTVNEWRVAMGYPRIIGDYGNSIIGSKTNAGSELPMVVAVESEEMNARDYKDYKDIVTEDFIKSVETTLGKTDLSGELIIMSPDTEEEKDAKKPKKQNRV